MTQTKKIMYSNGPSKVKNHSINADNQLGISDKQHRSCPHNMALISQKAKKEPHPLAMTGSSPGGSLRCCTEDNLNRHKARKHLSHFQMPE